MRRFFAVRKIHPGKSRRPDGALSCGEAIPAGCGPGPVLFPKLRRVGNAVPVAPGEEVFRCPILQNPFPPSWAIGASAGGIPAMESNLFKGLPADPGQAIQSIVHAHLNPEPEGQSARGVCSAYHCHGRQCSPGTNQRLEIKTNVYVMPQNTTLKHQERHPAKALRGPG